MSVWKCIHLYADADALSMIDPNHVVELSTQNFAPPATPMLVARAARASALAFLELPVGWRGGWHPSPSEQWVICLAGMMGYEAGDGSTFTLRAGSYILTTDTNGRGHNSWNAGPDPVQLAVIGI